MKINVREHATFRSDKMAKVALAATPRAQLDLYCLAPGQEQAPHAHVDQDKFYVVMEGQGEVVVDGARAVLGPGEAVVAPAGSSHGLRNSGTGPLLALVVVTPPPVHTA